MSNKPKFRQPRSTRIRRKLRYHAAQKRRYGFVFISGRGWRKMKEIFSQEADTQVPKYPPEQLYGRPD